MKIEYILKSKNKVTPDEKEQLEYLRLKGGHFWKEFTNRFKLGMIILAKSGDKIIGWGYIFERDDEKTLFIYVSNKYRRLGIGTEIYKRSVYNFGEELYVSKHDSRASSFFDSVGA